MLVWVLFLFSCLLWRCWKDVCILEISLRAMIFFLFLFFTGRLMKVTEDLLIYAFNDPWNNKCPYIMSPPSSWLPWSSLELTERKLMPWWDGVPNQMEIPKFSRELHPVSPDETRDAVRLIRDRNGSSAKAEIGLKITGDWSPSITLMLLFTFLTKPPEKNSLTLGNDIDFEFSDNLLYLLCQWYRPMCRCLQCSKSIQ